MTALTLKRIVADALAEIGLSQPMPSREPDKPRETVWFSMAQGFGMRCYPSGRRVYIVQSRMNGRLRTVTLGPTTLLTHAMATSIAKRVLAHALVGDDPAEDRKRIRKAPAFDDFVTEFWASRWPAWKPSSRQSQDHYRRMLIDGRFPERHIDEITPAEIARWFAWATDSCGPGGANRGLDIMHAMFNKAEQWGYRQENTNPCSGQRRNKPRRFERYLTTGQLAAVGAELQADRDGTDPVRAVQASAVLLLMLTGCRHSEILDLQWPDIAGLRIRLRDAKCGRRTVWLGQEARAVIDAIPRHPGVDWLFWNKRLKRKIDCVGAYWHAVQARAGIAGFRVHDLRHSFASHAVQRAETIPMVGRLLGHARVSSTLRYAHLDDAHALAASQKIADAIARMMDGIVDTRYRQADRRPSWCDASLAD